MDNLTPFGVGLCGLAVLAQIPVDAGSAMELLKELGSTGILAGVLYYVLKKQTTAMERIAETTERNGTKLTDLKTEIEILHHVKDPERVLHILEETKDE